MFRISIKEKVKETKTMLKQLLQTILLLSIVIIGGNLIAICQKITSNMPDYMMLLIIICFLIVAWIYVIKLIKSNGGF